MEIEFFRVDGGVTETTRAKMEGSDGLWIISASVGHILQGMILSNTTLRRKTITLYEIIATRAQAKKANSDSPTPVLRSTPSSFDTPGH